MKRNARCGFCKSLQHSLASVERLLYRQPCQEAFVESYGRSSCRSIRYGCGAPNCDRYWPALDQLLSNLLRVTRIQVDETRRMARREERTKLLSRNRNGVTGSVG